MSTATETSGTGSGRPAGSVADPTVPIAAGGHRPHLDGIRTLAVYLVVAFHAGLGAVTGGFVGVDVFFVLSGYLVTGVLLRDLRFEGRVRLARFYSRRVRRLLPAAIVTLLVTAAVFTAVATPLEVADGLRSVRASFLYSANWFFIRQSSDYFAADVNRSPVVHFWSLAIEEQFYLVWPLALAGLYALARRFGPRRWQALRGLVLVAGIASALLALARSGVDLNRAYYGTDTRAYELLAGAFVALSPRLVRLAAARASAARLAAPVGLAAIALLASSAVALNPIRRGILVTVATCVVLVSVEAADGVVTRLLSTGPIAYLGRISYGTYLWHWPVLVVAAQVFSMSPVSRFLLASLAASGIASLSYQVLEGPIRESRVLDRHRRPVIAAGLALSLLGAVALAPAILRPSATAGRTLDASGVRGGTPVPAGIDWQAVLDDRVDLPDCLGRSPAVCTVVPGSGQRILLLGNSHAAMLEPALAALAERRGDHLSVAIANSCPWQDGLVFTGPDAQQRSCRAHKADWAARVLPALDPDVIIVAGRTFDDPASSLPLRSASGAEVQAGDAGYDELVRSTTAATLDRLRAGGRKVVIIEPMPITSVEDDPLRCLSGATFAEPCRYVASPGPMPAERIYRSLAADRPGVWSLDLDELVCPYLPICDPIVDGMVVKFDYGHLTATYARSLSAPIEGVLVASEILG